MTGRIRTRNSIALAAVGAGMVAAPTALAATKSVTVGDNYFVRPKGVPTVTVERGDTVVWRFKGDAPHNVVATRAPAGAGFRSPMKSGGSYRRKLARRGTYKMICTVHGAADQKMRLRVR